LAGKRLTSTLRKEGPVRGKRNRTRESRLTKTRAGSWKGIHRGKEKREKRLHFPRRWHFYWQGTLLDRKGRTLDAGGGRDQGRKREKGERLTREQKNVFKIAFKKLKGEARYSKKDPRAPFAKERRGGHRRKKKKGGGTGGRLACPA